MTNEQIQALKAADPKRIAACVKACEGISTENLTNNVPLKQGLAGLNKRIRDAETQRDELLAEHDADKALIASQAKRIAELESQRQLAFMACNRWADKFREAEAKLGSRTLTVKLPESIPCPTAPEIIWLQTNGDDSDESKWPESDDDVSWFREKIFTNDTLYVRADLAAAGINLVVEE
ncbi:MAG: hypothetical protein E6265_25930 [Enterobacteriaceae bacterium]|nr:hypothetical protein [Enterobacteriaceae bacterium]